MQTRRTFVKSIGALGLTSGSLLPVLSAKQAPNLPKGEDYKALVCVYLHGGNDCLNMLPPADSANYQEYFDIRGGIGFNKTPKDYGAFPTDPYSHTPGFAGAKQPGMTGQVKEEVITRLIELGVFVSSGCICFNPFIIILSFF